MFHFLLVANNLGKVYLKKNSVIFFLERTDVESLK